MKRIIVLAIAIGLIAVPSATAHNTDWYWSPARAESKLLTTGQAANALNAQDVWGADCVGRGTRRNIDWIWSSTRPFRKLYRHFECFVEWTDYDGQGWEMETVLHVRGSQAFSLSRY